MSRSWTIEELDIAHPEVKAAGWSWELWDNGRTPVATSGMLYVVVTFALALVAANSDPADTGNLFKPPRGIALAVILASMGLPSLAIMADRLDKVADDEQARANILARGGLSDCIHGSKASGRAMQAAETAAMLRGVTGG